MSPESWRTLHSGVKLVPVSVIVVLASVVLRLVGLIDDSVGSGTTVMLRAAESPPGAGLRTTTGHDRSAFPVLPGSTTAVIRVEDTKAVEPCAIPLSSTCDCLQNPVPSTVIVVDASRWWYSVGLTLVMVGATG